MSLRLFVALDLPDGVKDDLLGMAHGLPGARWLDHDQLHLTLRFVGGDVDGAAYADLVHALSRARRIPPFELTLGGTGHFPPRGQARQVWAGVSRSDGLDALHRRVDAAVNRLGHKPDRRRWTPHVTLARLDGTPSRKLAEFATERALWRSEPFEVDAFHLYSSHLHPKGATYTVEETFRLD
ncbi:MAG: RNA 2',3'-cyclic phosphodiesterase [Proteobacteria bacterium]|nr:MAG: RNA 2',3'-cyclic phosphodiesterase [Pseudomonadota bacterium]